MVETRPRFTSENFPTRRYPESNLNFEEPENQRAAGREPTRPTLSENARLVGLTLDARRGELPRRAPRSKRLRFDLRRGAEVLPQVRTDLPTCDGYTPHEVEAPGGPIDLLGGDGPPRPYCSPLTDSGRFYVGGRKARAGAQDPVVVAYRDLLKLLY